MPDDILNLDPFYEWYVTDVHGKSDQEALQYGSTRKEQAKKLYIETIEDSFIESGGGTHIERFEATGEVSWGAYLDSYIAIQDGTYTPFIDYFMHDPDMAEYRQAALMATATIALNTGMTLAKIPPSVQVQIRGAVLPFIGAFSKDMEAVDPNASDSDQFDQLKAELRNIEADTDFLSSEFEAFLDFSDKKFGQIEKILDAVNSNIVKWKKAADTDFDSFAIGLIEITDLVNANISLTKQHMISTASLASDGLWDTELRKKYRELLELAKKEDVNSQQEFKKLFSEYIKKVQNKKDKLRKDQKKEEAERASAQAQGDFVKYLGAEVNGLLTIVDNFTNFIDDPQLKKDLKLTISTAKQVVSLITSLGSPIQVIAGITNIIVGFFNLMQGSSGVNPLQEVHDSLRDIILEEFDKISDQLDDITIINEVNHQEVMQTLRNIQLTVNGISIAVNRLSAQVSELQRSLDEAAQGQIQFSYSALISNARSASMEFHSHPDQVSDDLISEYSREWMTFLSIAPTNQIFSFPVDLTGNRKETLLGLVSGETSEILASIQLEVTYRTGVPSISSDFANLETLWHILPPFEQFLNVVTSKSKLQQSPYDFPEIPNRQKLKTLFWQCQDVWGLFLVVRGNHNLFRSLFYELLEYIDQYEEAVNNFFWEDGSFIKTLSLRYKSPAFKNDLRKFLKHQIVPLSESQKANGLKKLNRGSVSYTRRDWHKNILYPDEARKWNTKDKLGLIPCIRDSFRIERPNDNQRIIDYFDGIPYKHRDTRLYKLKDLKTVDQWSIGIMGPNSIGIKKYKIHDRWSWGGGVITVNDENYYGPEDVYSTEDDLVDKILDEIEFHLNDIVLLKNKGLFPFRNILSRALEKITKKIEPQFYGEIDMGYLNHPAQPFKISLVGTSSTIKDLKINEIVNYKTDYIKDDLLITRFFSLNEDLETEQSLNDQIKDLFSERFDNIKNQIRTGAGDLTKGNLKFRSSDNSGILDLIEQTIRKIKYFTSFAFENELLEDLVNSQLDQIQSDLINCNFKDYRSDNLFLSRDLFFKPLSFVSEGFEPALDETKRKIRLLSGSLDLGILNTRQLLLDDRKTISVDFKNCHLLMNIISDIIQTQFDVPLEIDEIQNNNVNNAISFMLEQQLLPPLMPSNFDDFNSMKENLILQEVSERIMTVLHKSSLEMRLNSEKYGEMTELLNSYRAKITTTSNTTQLKRLNTITLNRADKILGAGLGHLKEEFVSLQSQIELRFKLKRPLRNLDRRAPS